jgi:hypothetical protein
MSNPAQKFHELCKKIVSQTMYSKFAEAQANNSNFLKAYNSDTILLMLAGCVTAWEDEHVQFMPEEEPQAPDEEDEQDAPLVTREEAVKRASLQERDGYMKTYVLTQDEVLDRANLGSKYMITRTTKKDAPENMETKGHRRVHIVDGHGLAESNPAFVVGRNGYYYKVGFNGGVFEQAMCFYTWLEDPLKIEKKDNIGCMITFDLGWYLRVSEHHPRF